jgi:hypothetical protein
MASIQEVSDYEFYANLYPIIRDPWWEMGEMKHGSVGFRRNFPFDTPADYRNRSWAIGIVTEPSGWHYCWQAWMNGGGVSDRLDIPLDSSPEAAYAAAHAKAKEWFEGQTKVMLAMFQNRTVVMEPGEE